MAQTAFKDNTFANLYLQGDVSLDEVDDFVDAWHQGGTGLSLSAFLGLSREEYARWVEEPESLKAALNEKRHGRQPKVEHRIVAEKASVIKGASATPTRTSKVPKNAGEGRKRVQEQANLLRLVSDPTRLQVILMLAEGEKKVVDLCNELKQTQPTVSHHLALLTNRGIASRRREKQQFYELTDRGEKLVKVVERLLEREVPGTSTKKSRKKAVHFY